ncbi:class I SAM-dependent methyltransferase [Aureimonas sp. SK2]|uniref:class I SAM-dependent methyltransferase n=1 Tax=Aureimonas sp. SK2 TaxID=3015992 RepID=UPI0024441B0B|nr:class I SAM-dependent methyltransferase [Aureimonas sp. SK2]
MKPIDLAGFEAKFQASGDPWNYRTSAFEAAKRRVLLRACGPVRLGRGLELACAIGETSRALASRCLTLTATDGAPTALDTARRLTPPALRIDYRHAVLPQGVPRGPFDLVVVSEIAYYLSARDLDRLARRLARTLAPGGRIVVLHHVVPFDDTAQAPARAQERLCRALAGSMPRVVHRHHGRYAVSAFRRPR